MYKQLQTFHSYLDEIFNFVQDNIVSEAEQGSLLRRLDAIATCVRVKPIIQSESNDSEQTDFTELNGNESNGKGSNENQSENKKETDLFDCEKMNDIKDNEVAEEENKKNFVKEEDRKEFIKGTEINTEEKDTEDRSTEIRPRKSSLKTPNLPDFVKDQAQMLNPITIQLHVDEIDDDDGNDTDLLIDEDEKKDIIMPQVELQDELGDEDEDIPLLQIKHDENMVQYRASKEVLRDLESESDEFDSSNTQGERELSATLEVVRGIVEDIIEI